MMKEEEQTRQHMIFPMSGEEGGFHVPDLWMRTVQGMRQRDQERSMRRLRQAVRQLHM